MGCDRGGSRGQRKGRSTDRIIDQSRCRVEDNTKDLYGKCMMRARSWENTILIRDNDIGDKF